ncbi:TPR repeat-containing protein [Cytophaga hutchinsonii ATCC 33406]|uniref:TPR repeat-containing protein n=2 Tax=Cytophaga hutchinsonii TaxID=985 RepID=A0A6N4SSE9_CYTH3|nr:TPR repeat-containing protein [Cytophaga hutchinsonii ATCC 33406]
MYNSATVIYQNLLKSTPKKASEYYYYLGDICWRKEKTDSAKYYFMEGIKTDETYAMNYVGIGIITMKSNATEGQRSFDKALQMTSQKNSQVLNAIGEYYILEADKAELPKGIALLKKSTEIDAKNAMSWILLGDAYGKQAEGSKQAESYGKAANLFHSVPLLKMKYGKMYAAARNKDLSIKYYNEGLAADPTYGPIYRELGDLYNRFRQYDLAIQNYKKYLTYIDSNDDVEFRYADFLFKNNNYAEAIEVFNKLEAKKYNSPYIYNRRAVCYYELAKYDLAQKDIETYFSKVNATKAKSADFEYYGKILMKKGQDSLAIQQYQAAVDRDTTRLDMYGQIGSYFYNKGNFPLAIQYMSKQIRPTTTDPKVFYELGQAYYYNKEYVKADSSFVKVLELKPNIYIGYLWRARANAAQDPDTKQGLAKPYYEKLIEVCAPGGAKYKDELIEANEYIAYYYTINRDKVKADAAWKNILALDPTNKKAIDGLKMK